MVEAMDNFGRQRIIDTLYRGRTSNRRCLPIEYQMFQSNVVNAQSFRADGFNIVILTSQNQLGGDDLAGKLKVKVDPLPNSLSTQILPPCSSTNFFASVNPSPVPSTLCA